MALNINLKQKFNINDIHNIINNNEFTDWNKLNFEKIKNLYKNLEQITYGQKYVIKKINNSIINMYLDMNKIFNKYKTADILFFDGLYEVGKTFLTQQLAKKYFWWKWL